MADVDVTVAIRALDLTKGAVESAMRSLRKLTTEANVKQASSTVGNTFRKLASDAERYSRLSTDMLRKEVREREKAISTMVSMELRLRNHLTKQIGEEDRKSTRERLRNIAMLRQQMAKAQREELSEIRERDRAYNKSNKDIAAGYALAEKMRRQSERDKLRAMREAAKEEDRIRKQAVTAAKAYNKQVAADDLAAAKARSRLADTFANIGSGSMKGLRRMGFNAIFAGSVLGSQASMVGGQVGGSMSGLGSSLSGGLPNLTQLPQMMVNVLGKVVGLVARASGAILSLYTNVVTGIAGTLLSFIPKVGIFIGGFVTGIGNAAAGIIRGVTDIVIGGVDIISGALQGALNTAIGIASEIVGAIAGAIGKAFEMVGGIIGKIGSMAGEAFGTLLSKGIETFETMIGKVAEFRQAMADVFTQTPGMGKEGFAGMQDAVEEMAKRIPVKRTDMARALFEIVSTQLTKSPGEALQVLEGVSKAAVAGGHEANVVDTSKAATAVLSAFNMEAKDTEATLSKLFKAAVFGRFAFSDLAEGIQNVSGVAANFETSLDDLLSATVLASQSMAKSSVWVGVKNLILSLAAPTKEAKKAMDAAGIELKNFSDEEKKTMAQKREVIKSLEAEIRKFQDMEKKTQSQKIALREMKAALKELKAELSFTEKQSGTFVGLMEGIRRVQGAKLGRGVLREAIPEKRALQTFAAITSAMDRAPGVEAGIRDEKGEQLKTAYEIQAEQLKNHTQRLENIWEAAWKGIYDFTVPIFTRMMGQVGEKFDTFVKRLNDWLGPKAGAWQEGLMRLSDVVVEEVFGAANKVIDNWDTIVENATKVWNNLGVVFKAVGNIVREAMSALSETGAGDSIAEGIKKATNAAKDLWEAIKKISEGDFTPLHEAFAGLRVAWAEVMDFIRSSFASTLAAISGPLNDLVSNVEAKGMQMMHPLAAASSGFRDPRAIAQSYRDSKRFVADTRLDPTGYASPGSVLATQRPIEKALGYGLSPEVMPQLQEFLMGRAESGLYGSASKSVAAQDVAQDFLGGKRGVSRESQRKVKEALETDDDFDILYQFLQTISREAKRLSMYGFDSPEARQGAFSSTPIKMDSMIASLKEAQAPVVKAQVEAERAAREDAKATHERLDRLIAAAGGKPVTAVKAWVSPEMEGGDPEPKEDLNDIEEHTSEMAKDIHDLKPSLEDPENAFKGKAPQDRAPAPHDAEDAARRVLDNAIDVEGDRRPSKAKKPKKVKSLPPSWWPMGVNWDTNMSGADRSAERRDFGRTIGDGHEDHSGITRARRAWNRMKNATAFQPFGKQGAFGFHEGTGSPTLGDPIRDREGHIVGFRDFQGPPTRGYGPRLKHRVTSYGDPAKRGLDYDPTGGLPEGQISLNKLKAQREAEVEARRKKEADAFRFKDQARRANFATPPPGGLDRLLKGMERVPDGGGKEPAEGSMDAVIKQAVDAAEAAKEAASKQPDSLNALVEAQQNLDNDIKANADGIATFSGQTVASLEAVGVSVTTAMDVVATGQAKIADWLAQFKKDIDARIKKIEDATKAITASSGI